MIRMLFVWLCLLGAMGARGQELDPVAWRFSARKTGDKTYEVRLKATIQPPWHIYAQESPEGATLPTSINFVKNPLVLIQVKPQEVGNLVQHQDATTGLTIQYYAGEVEFVQVVKLKSAVKTRLEGTIEYMACTDRRCLQPMQRRFMVSLN